MRKLLTYASYGMFLLAGGMLYAFVYDVEPTNPAREYQLEKDHFSRTNDNWNQDFPSFSEWLGDQARSEERFHEWVTSVGDRLGNEFAEAVDPWYQDTREGAFAAAPDNWAMGERD